MTGVPQATTSHLADKKKIRSHPRKGFSLTCILNLSKPNDDDDEQYMMNHYKH